MLVEFLVHLFTLDIVWIVNLVLTNLHFLFVFFAISYFFFDGKNHILAMLLLILDVWLVADMEKVTGLVVFAGGFLTFLYITKLAIVVFAEDSKTLQKYIIPLSTAQAYGSFIIYNYVMV